MNLRLLIREIIESSYSKNLILENYENFKKIKDTYYPNLKLDESHLQDIYNILAQNNILKTNYINWIFLLIKNRVPRVLEDLDSIAKNLKIFNSYSKKIAADGISTMLYKKNGELIYKNQQDLYNVTSNYGKVATGEESKLITKGNYLVSQGQAEKIYEDSNYIVFRPDTYEASKQLACLSQWCTRFPEMYKHYSSQGPLYIILDKNKLDTNDRFRMIQFHIPSKQFKDALDREVPNRRVFMNNLKGLFNTMFPSALKEFNLISKGKRSMEDLTQSSRNARYIIPMDYWERLNIPCDEIQEKVASELGVDCKEVEEGDNGYIVNDKTYRVETVSDATEHAIESMLNSGFEDEWWIGMLPDYDWTDVFPKNDINVKDEVENEFGDEWEEVYEIFKEDLSEYGREYSQEEIKNGDFIEDINYNMFIDALEAYKAEDPIKYYTESMEMSLKDLNFIDLEDVATKYFENCYDDCLANWVSSYDGAAYYFRYNGEEYIMYRTD